MFEWKRTGAVSCVAAAALSVPFFRMAATGRRKEKVLNLVSPRDRSADPSRARRYAARGHSAPRAGPSHAPLERSQVTPSILTRRLFQDNIKLSVVFAAASALSKSKSPC
jgi:hypothetical protein